MPRTKLSEYSTTNTDNTDIESINIAEGCAPSGINNAIRELMVHLKEFQTGASGDAFTFAGGVLISGSPNTVSGAIVSSGNNSFSGTQTITGGINSSGSLNTFSGPQVISGTATISGNINSSGTNTFSGSQIISGGSTFSGAAKGSVTTDNDGSFSMTAGNNFLCTPTGNFTLTFTNITAGQSGNILLDNTSNYTVSAAAATKVATGVLSTLSATGKYWISYYSPDGTNVYISATGALA